jgi:hypothetical protein
MLVQAPHTSLALSDGAAIASTLDFIALTWSFMGHIFLLSSISPDMSLLNKHKESALVDFLHANHDAFAWKPSDMPGVPREVAEHELRIKPSSKPVHQCLRRFDDERCQAIGEEIAKLLAAGFVKEVYHSD